MENVLTSTGESISGEATATGAVEATHCVIAHTILPVTSMGISQTLVNVCVKGLTNGQGFICRDYK